MDIVLAQLDIPQGDPERAWLKIEQVMADATGRARLVVFPELATTGFDKNAIESEAKPLDDAPYRLTRFAVGYKVALLVSIPAIEKDLRFNTAFLVDDNGAVRAHYHKKHLFGPMREGDIFSAGTDECTALVGDWKVGISICYDLRFPIEFRKMAVDGAELLIVMAEWPASRIEHWRTLLRARAIENQAWVVGVNRVGTDGYSNFGGHSMVVAPDGSIKLELGDTEETATTHISKELINQAKRLFDVTKDEQLGI